MMRQALTRTFARGFAAKAERAPLKILSTSGQYAHMIMDACTEHKANPKAVSSNLLEFSEIYDANNDLKRLLDDADFTWEQKEEKLSSVFYEEMGFNSGSDEANMLKETVEVLVEDGEVGILEDVAEDLQKLALHNARETLCTVTSAAALNDAQTKKITQTLQGKVPQGDTVTINWEVDPSILGGLTMMMGDTFQDLSVKSAIFTSEQELRAM